MCTESSDSFWSAGLGMNVGELLLEAHCSIDEETGLQSVRDMLQATEILSSHAPGYYY